ncbi:Transmembrane protein 128 like protein [Aduncisulcus paluster]|uniref:Transmembrane protein 128 like protein n=1 Tax=Aduncisulcus paluster TaxID=2918883 RepID=A0ABQ5KGP8_9EUKA|nr:Transmembrane protein 128 like protein [Aduncisulcus paluster]|eukprot:gnl/Carplike_NY0171/1119_a1520_1721.p1 GENE.gnl/Carplike_NY0171/1119_a1520_1721~~gnl/Carplike_NY0171/1119_a1520_1721.p1  ORF type:complete len:208 (-),score=36.73 gnl/Carplike_NY0171/1119_a1520_1721:372-995(-)
MSADQSFDDGFHSEDHTVSNAASRFMESELANAKIREGVELIEQQSGILSLLEDILFISLFLIVSYASEFPKKVIYSEIPKNRYLYVGLFFVCVAVVCNIIFTVMNCLKPKKVAQLKSSLSTGTKKIKSDEPLPLTAMIATASFILALILFCPGLWPFYQGWTLVILVLCVLFLIGVISIMSDIGGWIQKQKMKKVTESEIPEAKSM